MVAELSGTAYLELHVNFYTSYLVRLQNVWEDKGFNWLEGSHHHL